MSLLGKILAILNVLAAIGFVFLAHLDLAKREAWADAALQHKILAEGLPVDEQEKDLQGNILVQDLRQPVLTQMFAKSGGDPSKTQMEEVRKVQSKVQSLVGQQENDAKKVQVLARILLGMATTNAEREARLKQLVDPANVKVDDLQNEVNAAFEAVLNPPKLQVSAKTDEEKQAALADYRRRAIAHLLVTMSDALREQENPQAPPELVDSKAYDRTLNVVGLAALAREVDSQAFTLQKIADEIPAVLALDRYAFVDAYDRQLHQNEDMSEKVDRNRVFLKLQRDMALRQEDLVKERRLQVAQFEKQLAMAQETTRDRLKEQAAMEQTLFRSRQELRDAFLENQKLEQAIRALEQGR
jgi:siroheme synthase (precorrin-2 oxidase/ferrochelatase)